MIVIGNLITDKSQVEVLLNKLRNTLSLQDNQSLTSARITNSSDFIINKESIIIKIVMRDVVMMVCYLIQLSYIVIYWRILVM